MKKIASRGPGSRRWIAAAVAAGLLAPAAFAQEQAAAPQAAPPDELVEPAAREAVKRMVDTLSKAERMSYSYDSEFDALQDDGEILEFGRSGSATIRRPDRLRGEMRSREGRRVRYYWDGKTVSLFDEGANAFASTPRTGDLDSLTDFLRDDIGFKMPLADLFGSDLGPMLVENVIAARLVDVQTIGDVECDHVALRLRQGVDVQLWIGKGEEALPQRLVFNFATADGRPQFRANFSDWDLSPRVPDRMFRFDAPKGAKVVPFVAPRRAAETGTPQAGGQ